MEKNHGIKVEKAIKHLVKVHFFFWSGVGIVCVGNFLYPPADIQP